MYFFLTLLILQATAIPRHLAPQTIATDTDDPYDKCYEDLSVVNTYVIAFTSTMSDSKTKTSPDACFDVEGYGERCVELYELEGTDFREGRGSWWTLDNWNGHDICDLKNFSFKANSDNGWGVNKVMVLVEATGGRSWVAVFYDDHTLWVDSDGTSEEKQQYFDIVDDFGKPKRDASDAKITRVNFIARSYEDSGAWPELHIMSNDAKKKAELYDIPNVDDYSDHRADIWQFTEAFELVRLNRVQQIWMTADNNDEWGWDRTAIIFETTNGYYLPVLNEEKHSLDTDDSDKMEVIFPLVHLWDQSTYMPEDINRGGYWKFLVEIAPFASHTHEMTASFQSEHGDIQETSEMKGFTDTYSRGGEFQLCEEQGFSSGVYTGKESACASVNWNHEQSSDWERTTTSTMEDRASLGLSVTCSETFECPGPNNIKPDEIDDVTAKATSCYLYNWNAYTYNVITDHTEMLPTCQFNLMLVHGDIPQCVPGQCMWEGKDCQECYGGPKLPPPEDNGDDSISIAVGNVSKHFVNNSWAYALLSTALVASMYAKYKFGEKKGEHYERLDMAKVEVSYST